MQTYLRKNSLFFARFLRTLAMGLLICLRARTPNLAAGNAPTTIATHQGRDNSFRTKRRERHTRTSKQHLTLFTAGWREHMFLTSNFAGRTSGKPGREERSKATMRRRGWDQTNLIVGWFFSHLKLCGFRWRFMNFQSRTGCKLTLRTLWQTYLSWK